MNVPFEVSRRQMLFSSLMATVAVLKGRTHAAEGFPAEDIPTEEVAPRSAHLPQAKPEEIGIDAQQLQVAYDLLEKWTSGPQPPVPGAAILVGRMGKTVIPRFFGRQGPEPDAEPLRRDSMFYMASVTKPVIYMTAMRFVERGMLNLSDPVTRYIPEFTGGRKEQTLVLHLFTHTSGLPDELPDNGELRKQHASLAKFVDEAIQAELLFPPGSQFSYASSGTILVAEILQRLSGMPINECVRDEICKPLGLESTGLGSQGFARDRLVRTTLPPYQQPEFGWNSQYWQEFGSPAGGLFSSPEDFAVICAAMLAGGQSGDVRLLSPATIRMMTTNRLNDLPDLPEPIRRTQPWGLGWRMNHVGTPGSWGDLLGRQVFGHTGSAGNVVWMDPETQGFCIVFTNYLRARAPWRLVHLSNAVAASFI